MALLLAAILGLTGDPPCPLADIGPAPAVALVDAHNRPFRLDSLRGKVVVVSFIYTTCNGTCPATTAELARVRKALKDEHLWGDKVAFVSVTLDPARDTPETLANYAHGYRVADDDWHFLTGPEAKVNASLKAWDMWARRLPDGAIDHPSRVFLVDPSGRRREIYSLETLSAKLVVADTRSLLAEAREMHRLSDKSPR